MTFQAVAELPRTAEVPRPQLDLANTVRITGLRAWMNRRLWLNDPDCLVARPGVEHREQWAAHLETYGGLRWSSDRLGALDARGARADPPLPIRPQPQLVATIRRFGDPECQLVATIRHFVGSG